ncbi:MAG: Mpo1-like protein [Betaproteobacteria bacterium]
MKSLEDQLSQYASYHRDLRNILTHFLGIPMIVFALLCLLSRPVLDLHGLMLSPALLLTLLSTIYYIRLDIKLGVLMFALLSLGLWFGYFIASKDTNTWLFISISTFIVGWIFQFIGHFWEGKKPAFLDDIAGLIIGPLFVVTEALFALGLLRELRSRIEERLVKIH